MFFKREVLVTRDLNKCNCIRDILSQNNIDHLVRTNTITNPGRHHGVPFIDMSAAYEYHIFVKRKDFFNAKTILKL